MKTLVLYTFHEVTPLVHHFVQNAVFQDDTVDFLFILNGVSLELNVPTYVKCIKRENVGHDFGGWAHAILSSDMYKQYDTFIFVNSTVYGPFLPEGSAKRWTDYYIEGLTDTVKLFGSTINTCFNPAELAHIQSYIFSMNKDTLEYLIDCNIFTRTVYARNDVIDKLEIGMSRRILEKGWNIGCLIERYKGVDWTFRDKRPCDYDIAFFGDIMWLECANSFWQYDELIFIKGNRFPI